MWIRAPVDNSDPCEEDMGVHVAQVADTGDVPQHLVELRELQ